MPPGRTGRSARRTGSSPRREGAGYQASVRSTVSLAPSLREEFSPPQSVVPRSHVFHLLPAFCFSPDDFLQKRASPVRWMSALLANAESLCREQRPQEEGRRGAVTHRAPRGRAQAGRRFTRGKRSTGGWLARALQEGRPDLCSRPPTHIGAPDTTRDLFRENSFFLSQTKGREGWSLRPRVWGWAWPRPARAPHLRKGSCHSSLFQERS